MKNIDQKTLSPSAQVLVDTLDSLRDKNYRNGFNDSVLTHCCDALEKFNGTGPALWSYMCCGDRQSALDEFMDSNPDILDYYDAVEKMASGSGAFVMPEWGIRGT